MLKMIMTKGLPASGKSTWAKKMIDNNPGVYKRANKDDLRMMLDNSKWSKSNEKFVLQIRDEIILQSLVNGKHVIVDDSNFAPIHLERMKQSRYLPPAELETPLCPICQGKVHNKDLIYQNSEIAKAIIEQGKDIMIGVRTALCCGCYGKFMQDRTRRQLITHLVKGDYVYWNDVKKTVKEVFSVDIPKEERVEGEGTLMIDDYPLAEFASLHGELKLPSNLEEEAIKLARSIETGANETEAEAN